jgi:hypothetical protein
LKAGLLKYAQLTEIYRQQSNPELLAAVKDAAEDRYQESFDKVKAAGWIHVADNEHELRVKLVNAIASSAIPHLKRGSALALLSTPLFPALLFHS